MLVSIVLLSIAFVGSAILLTLYLRQDKKESVENKPKQEKIFKSKETDKLVKEEEITTDIVVNPEYEGLGVKDVKSSQEYAQLILDNSTILSEGTKPLGGSELLKMQELLKDFISSIPYDDSYATSSPAKSELYEVYRKFLGNTNNPMALLDFILLHNHIKVEEANFYLTGSEGEYAFEFVIEDLEGKQLAYVTGFFGDYSKRFNPTYVTPLGYGQLFMNDNVQNNLPPKIGL